MKYLVRQPATLERLTIEKLGAWIAAQAKLLLLLPLSETHEQDANKADQILSQHIAVIRDYLEYYLPTKLHDNLATELSSTLVEIEQLLNHSDNFERTIIGRFIETLFTKNLTRLSFYEDGTEIFFPSLYSKSYMLSGLIELKLNDYNRSIDADIVTEYDIIKLLQELRNLKRLSLCCYKLDKILLCIAENCQLIEELSLSSRETIGETCFRRLVELYNLKRLELNIPDESEEGIASLLMSCDKLVHIQIRPPTLLLALTHIISLNHISGKRLKIKSYIDGSGSLISMQRLSSVVEMCPHIQELSLTNYETNENYLMPLHHLQELRKLTLVKFKFNADHVDELLRAIGRNLLHLHLESVYQIDLNALRCISKECPNLKSLFMRWCRIETDSSTCDLLTCHSFTSPSFNNLKNISLEASYSKGGQSTDELLFFLLSVSPNVEFISINEAPLMDEFWLRLLDRNPLKHLKQLDIYLDAHSPPSTFILDRIVQHSINRPEIVIVDSDSDSDSY